MADETIFRIKERIRQEMRDLLGVTMADGGAIDRQALPAQIDSVAHEVCADFGISDENWIGYIIKSTIDDFIGLGPLQPLQDDPKVAEIFIDPVGVEPNGTFITPVARAEVDGQIVDCPGIDLVSHDEVGRLIGRIAEEANRRCDDSFPEMDATLADGSRVHAAHPKVSPNGWSLNIRKFSKDKLTAEDLLERGAMSEPMYMFLKSAVQARANFIISGGTGAFTRIENMILKSQGNMTMEAIRRQIGAAIDVVVQVKRWRGGYRRIESITAVEGFSDGNVTRNELFHWEGSPENGRHVATGYQPARLKEKILDADAEYDPRWFEGGVW